MARIKEDIIRETMSLVGFDRIKSGKMIESLLKIVKNTLASGEGIMISGFGEFRIKHKRARPGRNPKTKVEHEISERKVVTFHPSKVFRHEISS